MNKEIITNKQGIFIVVLYVLGSSVVLSIGGEAKQDAWLSILLGFVMAVPMIIIYARILDLFPEKDLFDILNEVFGKILGKAIALAFIWYAFHLGALVIRNFSEFIHILALPFTPQLVIVLFTGLICIWSVKTGIESMARCSGFVFPILLFIIFGSLVLSSTDVDINNIKPVLYNGVQPVIWGAFQVFSFPFCETVVFMMIFCSIKSKFNTYKVFLIGLVSGAVILLAICVKNILFLGVPTEAGLYFPSYTAVAMIQIGTFIQRIEIIVSVVFLFAGIGKICDCLYAVSNGISKVFNLGSHRTVTVPIGLLMMGLSCLIYNNTMEMFEWATKIYPYYAIPFQVIFPVIIWVLAEIKQRNIMHWGNKH